MTNGPRTLIHEELELVEISSLPLQIAHMYPNGLFIRHTGIEQKLRSPNDVGYPVAHLVIFHADGFLAASNSLVALTIHPPLRRIRIAIGND